MGSEDVATENNPVAHDGTLCMVKFTIKNFNTNHDLRIQLFKVGDAEDLESANYFTTSIALGLMAVIALMV